MKVQIIKLRLMGNKVNKQVVYSLSNEVFLFLL